MERELETVVLPSGQRVNICEFLHMDNPGELRPGLKFLRVDGETVPLAWGRDLLMREGRHDLIDRYRIP